MLELCFVPLSPGPPLRVICFEVTKSNINLAKCSIYGTVLSLHYREISLTRCENLAVKYNHNSGVRWFTSNSPKLG